MYDIEFTNTTTKEEGFLNFRHDCLEFITENYGINKRVINAKNKKFLFDEILKLTIKFFSSLSNIIIFYYVKHRIPIVHRLFFRIISQNPAYVKTRSNDMENPLNLAIRKWMIKQEN